MAFGFLKRNRGGGDGDGERRIPRKDRRGMSTAMVGLLFLIVICVATYLGFTKDIPFTKGYRTNAVFESAVSIRKNSPVRIAGVDVGKVKSVKRYQNTNMSVVEMEIKKQGLPIHKDATAKIRPRIFLEGNFYVDLSPGSPGEPPMKAGGMIPVTRTSNPVQIGEVLSMLKSDTRQDLKNTLKGLGDAQKAGAGKEFNRALEDQGEAFKYSAIVSEALLGESPNDLARYIRAQGTVSDALNANPEQLKNLVTDFNRTAAALADREADLRRAVGELPGTLREALPTFTALNRTFPGLRRFARESLPAIRSSRSAIDASIPLVKQLRGLVRENELRGLSRDLRRSTPSLVRLAEETVPLLETARELASCTSNVLVPWGADTVKDRAFPAVGPVNTEFGKSLANLAGESRSFDANGQWFKVLGGGGVETLDLGNNIFGVATNPVVGVNPPPVRKRPPLRPEVPCETQETPDLDSRPANPPRSPNNPQKSPKALARLEKSRALALAVLQARLRTSGDTRTVIDEDATLEDLKALAKKNGNLPQLDEMAKKASKVLEGRK